MAPLTPTAEDLKKRQSTKTNPADDIPDDPKEAFRRLRQALDNCKSNYGDPWSWHDYLGEDVNSDDEEEVDDIGIDPEVKALMPKARSHQERLKSHLLACAAELQRAAQAANRCFYHVSCRPEVIHPCVLILGTSGDIDAEELLASGGAGPEALLGILQDKLEVLKHKMEEMEDTIEALNEEVSTLTATKEDYWTQWQGAAFVREEATMRLDSTETDRRFHVLRGERMEAKINDLQRQLFEAIEAKRQRTLKFLRDIFGMQQENLIKEMFQFFKVEMQKERAERLRREREAQRDSIEGALRNEVNYVNTEMPRREREIRTVVQEIGVLKGQRRDLACRLLYKHRPYTDKEYLWNVFLSWQPVRQEMRLEKLLEQEESSRKNYEQLYWEASTQQRLATTKASALEYDVVSERAQRDCERRKVVAAGAARTAVLLDRMQAHRQEELEVIESLHVIDCNERDEKIEVLEREIAEDTHIKSLKKMIVDLEGRLHVFEERKRQRAPLLEEKRDGAGPKCVSCTRETLYKGWHALSPDCDPSRPTSSVLGSTYYDTSDGFKKTGLGTTFNLGETGPLSTRTSPGFTKTDGFKDLTGQLGLSPMSRTMSCKTLAPLTSRSRKLHRPNSTCNLSTVRQLSQCTDRGPGELELGFRPPAWRV